MSNICKYINSLNGLQLVPGRHFPIELGDGTKLVKFFFNYLLNLLNSNAFVFF